MNYRETLHAIDTGKALAMLGFVPDINGKYAKIPCPACQQPAVFTTYGEKKNLYYCPKCKTGGNILKLTMQVKGLDWEPAKAFLKEAVPEKKKTVEPLKFNWELAYDKYLEKLGISEETAKEFEVGVPQGRTSLAGCLVFAVRNEVGTLVAYHGIAITDRKTKPNMYFNPEDYLWGFNRIDKQQDVVICTDITLALKSWSDGKQAVSTFGLPYLSQRHLELLNQCLMLTAFRADPEIVKQISANFKSYTRFIG